MKLMVNNFSLINILISYYIVKQVKQVYNTPIMDLGLDLQILNTC